MCRIRGGIDLLVCIAVAWLTILYNVNYQAEAYKIGVGRADCTGPSVEVIFVSIKGFGDKKKQIDLRRRMSEINENECNKVTKVIIEEATWWRNFSVLYLGQLIVHTEVMKVVSFTKRQICTIISGRIKRFLETLIRKQVFKNKPKKPS